MHYASPMHDRSRNVIVGTTALAGLVGLAVLLFLFGYVPVFLRGGYEIELDMADAVELNVGSDVKLSGIAVGQVRTIDFKPGDAPGVLVTAFIREGVRIPADVVAEVDTDLLGGTATVKLVSSGEAATFEEGARYLPQDGSARIDGKLGSLAGAFASLNALTQSIESVSAEWETVGANVNRLLDANGMSVTDPSSGEVTDERNLVNAVGDLNRRLDQLGSVLDGIQSYTGDADLRARINETIENGRAASARFDELADSYLELANESTAAVRTLQETLELAKAGEGTLGRLLTDPAIFDNFADTANRISRMADEATLLIQKFRDEGVPINF